MFTLIKSIDLDASHFVSGHNGGCINNHGHTWKFEIVIAADSLDPMGFVWDFKEMKRRILQPIHQLMDHSLITSERILAMVDESGKTYKSALETMGRIQLSTRAVTEDPTCAPGYGAVLNHARNEYIGGMKVAVMPFVPTSERLAEWFYGVAGEAVLTDPTQIARRLHVVEARVYETIHPVESIAIFSGKTSTN